MTKDRTETATLVDGENNPVVYDEIIQVGRSMVETLDSMQSRPGADIAWLPMSGMSAGTGIFQVTAGEGKRVVGIKVNSPAVIEPQIEACADLRSLSTGDVIIDTGSNEICCGCGLTLEQINQALSDTLGADYMVLGADLTSFQYATAGASFMTGGMGPQRRYFSDSVQEIALYDGRQHRLISGEALGSLAGTYGWTGMVTALRCRYYRLPHNEIAIALPVSNEPDSLAKLLASFAPYCSLLTENGRVGSRGSDDIAVLGIEHVTTGSMQPLFRFGTDEAMLKRARQVEQNCLEAGVEGIVFISGYCDQPVDEFLERLIEDNHGEVMTIAGIDVEHAEVFSSAEEMRALREAIPYAARMQQSGGTYGYKSHTDATMRLQIGRAHV